MHIAAGKGHVKTVEYLAAKAGTKIEDQSGVSMYIVEVLEVKALHVSTPCTCMYNSISFVNQLHNFVLLLCLRQRTPLYIAAKGGHLDTVEYLDKMDGDAFNITDVSRVSNLSCIEGE